jgi:diketogulonate reductase-like aldo/keto reductase
MQMQIVEANGARIPQVGLGTWELRGDVCTALVKDALKLGYRHIDTAEMYENEAAVGEGIRASGVARNELFITTKVWYTHFEPAALLMSAKESLAKIKLDHVDLLLLHWPNPSVPLEETIGALNDAKTRGLTQHIGIANFTVDLVRQAVELSKAPLVTNQIEIHPYLDQSKVMAVCEHFGISLTAYSPVAKGAVMRDQMLKQIAAAHKKSPAQIALRYLVQQGIIVIPRTSKPERLAENAALFDFALSDAEMQAIRRLAGAKNRLVQPSWSPAWD